MEDTVVIIPSKRKPPLKTYQHIVDHPNWQLAPDVQVVILADPDVVDEIQSWVKMNHYNATVIHGEKGLAPQIAECYRVAHLLQYKYWFRLDDDLQEDMFICEDRDDVVTLNEAIEHAYRCAEQLKVSLVGFSNTARRDWLGDGYTRSYGLIHGGAQLCRSSPKPEDFIDVTLPRYEDVYRSASHRRADGAVGRVNFIGLEKRVSQRDSSLDKATVDVELCKKIILGKFPGMVTCKGTRILDGGRQEIPNWRLQRGGCFTPEED